jgi:beta-alanine--pyruvate transaminase
MAPFLEETVHGLKGLPGVIDVRNLGLVAGIEMEPRPGKPNTRGYEVFVKCFEAGVLVRMAGDIIALSPPLIVERPQIERIVETLASAIKSVG